MTWLWSTCNLVERHIYYKTDIFDTGQQYIRKQEIELKFQKHFEPMLNFLVMLLWWAWKPLNTVGDKCHKHCWSKFKARNSIDDNSFKWWQRRDEATFLSFLLNSTLMLLLKGKMCHFNAPCVESKNSCRRPGLFSLFSYWNACEIISKRSRSFTNLASGDDCSSYSCNQKINRMAKVWTK